jgi:Tfp pilus assembly protein PilO
VALKAGASLKNFSFSNLTNIFIGLSPRDRLFALGMVAVAMVLVLFLPISIATGKINVLEKEIKGSQGKFRDVLEKVNEYNQIQNDLKGLEAKFGSDFVSLTTQIENIASQSGVKGNVKSLKEAPTREGDLFETRSANLQLNGISINQLVDFIYQVENNSKALMRFRKFIVKTKYSSRSLLDVQCEIATYRLIE